MMTICLQCGEEGAANAFIYCINCLKYAVHRYCLDELPESLDEFVPWACDDCNGVAQKVTSSSVLYVQTGRKDQDQDRTSSKHVESSCKKQLLEGKTTTKTVNAQLASECTPDLKLKQKSNNTTAILREGTKQLPQSASWQQLLGTKPEAGSPYSESTDYEATVKNNTLEKKGTRKNMFSHRLKSFQLSGNLYKEKAINDLTECRKTSDSNILVGLEQGVASDSMAKLDYRRRQYEGNTNLKEIDQARNELHLNKLKKRNPDSLLTDASQAGLEQEEEETHHSSLLSKPSLNPWLVSCEVAQPVIDPIWSGSFNILNSKKESDGVDILVVAHLSKKVGKQVYDEAILFPSMLELELHPKADVWPKRFQELRPSDDDIAIYFFPMSKRYEGVFDQLVEEMMDQELSLKSITENAELLVFPSNELPLNFWRFQGKYFLWGVFRGKQQPTN